MNKVKAFQDFKEMIELETAINSWAKDEMISVVSIGLTCNNNLYTALVVYEPFNMY